MEVKLIALTEYLDPERPEQLYGTPEQLIEHAGHVCYAATDRDGEDTGRFVRERIKHGHLSLIEHAVCSFEISGISRACSHQLVRHRLASYCLSGDTMVVAYTDKKSRSPKRWTVGQLFNWSTDPKRKGRLKLIRLRSVDDSGILVPNQIGSVVYTGKQETYTLTTESHREIRATGKHRFLTMDGWKKLEDLVVGNRVMANGVAVYRNEEWLKSKYLVENMTQSQIGELCGVSKECIKSWVARFGLRKLRSQYPNRQPGYGVPGMFSEEARHELSRQKMGSNNPMWLGDQASAHAGRLRAQRLYVADVCEYCGGTDLLLRHHIDGNALNNVSSNVRILCEPCHKATHIGQAVLAVYSVPISAIEPFGVEDTYDLSMAEEPFNFVANGLVVHNSQESQRYVDYDALCTNIDMVATLPHVSDGELAAACLKLFVRPPDMHQGFWARYMAMAAQAYLDARFRGNKPEDARYVLPNATKTNIVMTANFREWRYIIKLRAAPAAQWEIVSLMTRIKEILQQEAPNVFGDL